MNPNFSVHPNNFSSLMLFGLSLGNYALMFVANVFLARQLSIEAFDDYSVSVSVVTLLSTLATLGLDKYALRLVALNIERENWGRLRSFLRFSTRTILLFSCVLLVILSVTLEGILAWKQADFHISIVIYAAFLPIIAISLFLIEIVTVFGFQIMALALYRACLPGLFIIFLFVVWQSNIAQSAVSSVICLGLAWCATLFLLITAAKIVCPQALRRAKPDSQDRRKWISKALPLLIGSLMMTILTNAGTIVLELLHPSEMQVGLFSVIMQTSGLLVLIGTSTNRYYLPMLMVLLERRDAKGIKRLLHKRTRLITGFLILYLSAIVFLGAEILALFGRDFSEGYLALCISTLGAAINTLYSDAPYYLQFMGQNRAVVYWMAFSAIGMLVLSFLLGLRYGATGVAIAYALPTAILFCSLKLRASRHLRHYLALNAPV
ncbi:MAG: oligosaccharide flippase family protein [Methylomonas sp.]|nr:oligosaccharide flippase family protein [Methylomonas sp.]